MITKKYWFLIAVLAFTVTSMLPNKTKALTYNEIVTGEQAAPQGRVLGTVTPTPDINGDGVVNSFDAAVIVGHMGENYTQADLNRDGVVNSLDLSTLSAWWFATK